MALDGYSYCPCGSGKKIKFCCSKDILPDLERVLRALEGDQRKAGLDLLDRLIAKHGPRPALLALKCTTELVAGDHQACAATVDLFRRQAPDNPIAYAAQAALTVMGGDAKSAVPLLQKALELGTEAVPSVVYETVGLVGQGLIIAGRVPSGMAHLHFYLALNQDDEPRYHKLILSIYSTPQVPLLLKDWSYLAGLTGPTPESPWADEFQAARLPATRGAWAAAAERLEALAERVGADPVLLRVLATLKSWIDDDAASAWRRYAACPGVALDDAVEAEAVAQLLERRDDPSIDVVRFVQPISDAGQALERMVSDRRFVSEDFEADATGEDEPPPKAVFTLLDRPQPPSVADLSCREIPNVLGEMYVFGRQTDRSARVELVAKRTPHLAAARAVLGELLAELVQQPASEEVIDQVTAVSVALDASWRLPDDTPGEVRRRFHAEHKQLALSERWPDTPLSQLDGRTPRQAAAEAALRVRVLAAILLLELSLSAAGEEFDFNALRRNLGLPTREPIDPAAVDVKQIPLARLALIPPAALSDDDLIACYERAAMFAHTAALRALAREVLARPSLDERVNKAVAHDELARAASDPAEAASHLQAAQQAAREKGQSPAPWLLAELAMHLQYQNLDRCEEVFHELRARHLREPGVRESMLGLFRQFGLVDESGRPTSSRAPGSTEERAEPAASTSPLWTPDQPDSASGQKSKLWVPGSE